MILEINNIVKYFNGFCALTNVKLEVQENSLQVLNEFDQLEDEILE